MKLCTTCGAHLEDNAAVCAVCQSPLFAVAGGGGSDDDDFDDFEEAEPTVAMSANDAVSALLASAAASAKRPPSPKPDAAAVEDATAVLTADALASLQSNPHLQSLIAGGKPGGGDEADPTMMMDAGDQNAYLEAARALAAQHEAQHAAAVAATVRMEPVSGPQTPAPKPGIPAEDVSVSSLIAGVLGDAGSGPAVQSMSLTGELAPPTPQRTSSASLHAPPPPSGVPMPPPRPAATSGGGGGGKVIIGVVVALVLLVALAAGAWFALPMLGVKLPF